MRCGARCDVSPMHTQYSITLKVARMRRVGTVCIVRVLLLVCMGKTRFGGIIWGEVVMMHCM